MAAVKRQNTTKQRRFRKLLLTVSACVGFLTLASAQTTSPLPDSLIENSVQTPASILFPKKNKVVSPTLLTLNQSYTDQKTLFKISAPYLKYYHESLGVMCQLENKFSKTSKRAIRMRLGTVQYVDKLEGKSASY